MRLRLFFLTNFPGTMFIPDFRVVEQSAACNFTVSEKFLVQFILQWIFKLNFRKYLAPMC
jgi:hypothetical protein